jgi:hypothetical protein
MKVGILGRERRRREDKRKGTGHYGEDVRTKADFQDNLQ